MEGVPSSLQGWWGGTGRLQSSIGFVTDWIIWNRDNFVSLYLGQKLYAFVFVLSML